MGSVGWGEARFIGAGSSASSRHRCDGRQPRATVRHQLCQYICHGNGNDTHETIACHVVLLVRRGIHAETTLAGTDVLAPSADIVLQCSAITLIHINAGLLGARSPKWMERPNIRHAPPDGFYGLQRPDDRLAAAGGDALGDRIVRSLRNRVSVAGQATRNTQALQSAGLLFDPGWRP